MKFLICLLAVLFLCIPRTWAQSPAQGPAQGSAQSQAQGPAQTTVPRTEMPYLLPQTIFVGDQGRLVVPLGQGFSRAEPFVLDSPDLLPIAPDMVIRRIELENRGAGGRNTDAGPRLLIDFIPYAPGVIVFPPLELGFLIPPDEEDEAIPIVIYGLEAHVASILNPARMDLSEPAPPLVVPGTSLLVYGTVILILFILFFGIGGSIWFRRNFKELWERIRRQHFLRVMTRFLRRLKQEIDNNEEEKAGYYITLLSSEFREFLSFFTGVNCRSLTAVEFLELPLTYDKVPAEIMAYNVTDPSWLNPVWLCRLFRSWDTLRFSGLKIEKTDLYYAINEVDKFIGALYTAEKEKRLEKENPGAEKTYGY